MPGDKRIKNLLTRNTINSELLREIYKCKLANSFSISLHVKYIAISKKYLNNEIFFITQCKICIKNNCFTI